MITADADFIACEAKKTYRPYFDAYFYPYYYPTDVDDGTFVNCFLQLAGEDIESPIGFGDEDLGELGWGLGLLSDSSLSLPSGDRIVIYYGATSASWTSPVITNPAEILPAAPTPTWEVNKPGYSMVAEYRTSDNYNQVSTLAWSTLTANTTVALYKYYQIRFVWTPIRAWVFKTQAEAVASPYSFYFIPSLPDASASYFCPGNGIISYLENLLLTGEYEVNPDDVTDMGEFSEELGGDFGKVVAGEHTMVLIDRDNKFTPGHANFIFKDSNWFRKGIRVAMGYLQSAGTDNPINLYRGTVLKWGPRTKRIDPDTQMAEPTVEVYSKSIVAKLLEKEIGLTDDDGVPHPWVCGEILHELTQLADESPVAPEKTVAAVADFSTTSVTGGSNTLANSSSIQFKGADTIKSHVQSLGKAVGYADLALPANRLLLSAWIRFDTIPTNINDKQMGFLGWLLADGDWAMALGVGTDTKVSLYFNGAWEETSWYLNQDVGVFKRVSIALAALGTIDGKDCGIVKVYVNGDEVLSKTGDYSSLASAKRSFAGAWLVNYPETWDVYLADIEVSTGWEPYAYRLYGAPYQSFGAVYQDGTIQQEVKQTATPGAWAQPKSLIDYFKPTYIPGSIIESDLISKNPRSGIVIFNDYANPPQGTIFIRAKKDDNRHPADIIKLMLDDAGLGSYADMNPDPITHPNSFPACKTALPDDVIGCWFEDSNLGDAIAAIGSRCLINILATLDTVRLLPYQGVAGSSVRTIADWIGYDHSFEMEDMTSRTKVTWGWYERNKLLVYIASDAAALAEVGQKDIEIDFTWGNEVATDNESMAKQKADWLLNRVKGGQEILEDFTAPYSQARLEVGDTITVTSDDLFSAVFMLTKKTMKLSPDYELSFDAVKFLGE